jgi:hypothetical protein
MQAKVRRPNVRMWRNVGGPGPRPDGLSGLAHVLPH